MDPLERKSALDAAARVRTDYVPRRTPRVGMDKATGDFDKRFPEVARVGTV